MTNMPMTTIRRRTPSMSSMTTTNNKTHLIPSKRAPIMDMKLMILSDLSLTITNQMTGSKI